MEIVYTSQDKTISVIQENKRKLTQAEAGFIEPENEKERFCCGNCVRYNRKNRTCAIVEGNDIEEIDCCNHYLNRNTYKTQPDKEGALIKYQQDNIKIYIESGMASSRDAAAIVNGIAYAKINVNVLRQMIEVCDTTDKMGNLNISKPDNDYYEVVDN